ncbi:hypothetical protein [Mariprofundus micogutta]|uniref:hypothetical protein n=1 Tax=Mariprofundus micogutta TaxID=1921010 RepID=UPI000933FC65|nr:hypothetical protein [Mariprofundus micogutta]
MRYLAWIAVFSLQMGIFICGSGVGECYASDTPAHIEASKSNPNQDGAPIDQICSAQCAHIFMGQLSNNQIQPEIYVEPVNLLASLNLPEIFNLIEQPPKFLHS